MDKPRLFGDGFHGEIGFAQKSFHFEKPDSSDFLFGCALEDLFHPAVERAPRGVEASADIFDVEALERIFPDNTHGLGHKRIVDHQFV